MNTHNAEDPTHTRTVFEILDEARLSYAVRHTPTGESFAGFRWQGGAGPVMGFTAMNWLGAFRLTLHDAVSESDAADRRSLNKELDFVVALPGSDGLTDLAVLIPSDVTLHGSDVIALLTHLASVLEWTGTRIAPRPDRPVLNSPDDGSGTPWIDHLEPVTNGANFGPHRVDEAQRRLACGRLIQQSEGLVLHIPVPASTTGRPPDLATFASDARAIWRQSEDW